MLDLLYDVAVHQLNTLDPHIKLVIIHPKYVAHHPLLAALLDHELVLYVRFSGSQLRQHQLVDQLYNALGRQSEVTDLQSANMLIFDEVDRAEAESIESFLIQIIPLVSKGRILLFSRKIPRSVIARPDLRPVTRFVPTEQSLLYWDYVQNTPDKRLLEVQTLGNGYVLLDGEVVAEWDGLLPRMLFFYFVDRGMATRDDIFRTFWPELPAREATNVFHVTKRKINEVLGIDLTAYGSGFYQIAPNIQLSYDAIRFHEMTQQSQVATAREAVELLRRAVALYRGDYISSLSASWIVARREELQQAYVDALVNLARLLLADNQIDEALGLYLRAAPLAPYREDIVAEIMRIAVKLGMRRTGILAFRRLETELDQKLGMTPSQKLIDLFNDLQNDSLAAE